MFFCRYNVIPLSRFLRYNVISLSRYNDISLLHRHFLQEFDARVDVLEHHFVDVNKIDLLAEVGNKFLDDWAALETFLMAEIESLSCVEKLDGEYAFGILANAIAFCGCVATHAYEVFLVLAAGNTVDAAWGAELFALAYNSSCGVLWNHEAAVETWLGNKEGGKTTFGINKLIGATFTYGSELGNSYSKEVEHHSHRLTMEVATTDNHILIGEDNGIVGSRINLCLDDAGNVCYGVLSSTVYLRGATERVGVLDMLFVATDDVAAFGESADSFCSLQLAFVGANHVEALEERFDATVESIKAKTRNAKTW